MHNKKIVAFSQWTRNLLPIDKKIVLVGGCFDIFHYGHLIFLQKAKTEGDYLIVALESDFFIRKKGKALFHIQKQRAEILASLILVDLVLLLPYWQEDKNYFSLVKAVSPQVIAVSAHDPKYKIKKQQADLIGAKIKIVTPLLDNFSSSIIKDKYESFSCH
jgi:cytidyltransferase-like protein